LLLVGAIGLAILLTALALALNTAVYAELHVSETDTGIQEQRGAIQYQESVQRAVAGMLTSDAGAIESESDLRGNVTAWDNLSRPAYARDGVATNVSVTGVTIENRIVQNTTRSFEDHSGADDWTVAGNASAVEDYDARFQAAGLAETDDCTSTACFTLRVEDADGDSWQMAVYTDPANDTVEADVETANGTTTNCVAEASETTVNVTDGTFYEEDGTACSFVSFTQDDQLDSPYTLRYENAHNATGTYNLSVTGDVVGDSIAADSRYDATDSPRIEPEVVAATVSISYRSADLTYRTEIRVAPGDGDG
jgi:hypothetical protein